jgi:hypothetical protein
LNRYTKRRYGVGTGYEHFTTEKYRTKKQAKVGRYAAGKMV